MAKATNCFVTGKMNKDRDDRLLQANEYRNAMNAQVSRSEGANVGCLLYTSPSPRDGLLSRMPSSA